MEFAEFVFPRLTAWLEQAPAGVNPTSHLKGPFSSIQFNDSTASEIAHGLGLIAFQLRYKLGTTVDSVLMGWLQRSVLTPEPKAIPMMIYTALPAVTSLSEAVTGDLLTTCQTLLLHLWERHLVEESAGDHLASAIDHMSMILRNEDGLVKWNTDNGRKVLENLMIKFSPMFVAFSRSTHPEVRASVAELTRNLMGWRKLTTEMEETLERLRNDNRARVRRKALTAS
jgi:hypothetical protein